MSQTQLVRVLFLYKLWLKKVDYMFRPSSLGHHQVISLYRGKCTIYDVMCEI